MATNVIKQIVNDGEYGSQTIRMIVHPNERGPQGIQGVQGVQGIQGPAGPRGADGYIQYQAGTGIAISSDNVITATGDATATWGGLHGDIQMQTDLQEEFNEYTKTDNLAAVALSNSYNDLDDQPTIPTVNNASLFIVHNGTQLAQFTANSVTDKTANIVSPVITMTTTDPGEGSTLATNNYVGVYGDDPIILDYSTSEVNTGAKWVDGSAIYKKTINFGALPNATTKTVAHGISGLSQVVRLEGIISRPGGVYSPAPFVSYSSISDQIELSVHNTEVLASTGYDWSTSTAYITIYYTKSS